MISLELVSGVFDKGGVVVWLLLLVCFVMWILIAERFWFYLVELPSILNQSEDVVEADQRNGWIAEKIRDAWLSRANLQIYRNLSIIKTLVALCPMIGLLGTVLGMIHVFDVMAIMGTSDARAMASAIYSATIPTLVGLVVALPGFFIVSRLRQRASDAMLVISQRS